MHTEVLGVRRGISRRPLHKGAMCLAGLALEHLASKTLVAYDKKGYPIKTGRDRRNKELDALVRQEPHKPALGTSTTRQLQQEV